MATLATQGFRTNVLPQYTPIDPRDAVRDPFAFSTGITRGMADMRALEEDAILRGDRPRQQLLRDIELAQAQAEMANMPRVNRLKDLQLAEAERRFRIGALEPIAQGQPVRELDESGNLIQYQPTLDFNPATGLPYGPAEKPAMDTSLIKTRQQMESEQRAMEALAQQRTASGEAALIRATNPRTTMKSSVNAQNQIIDQWFAPDGTPVTDPTLRLGPDGQPLIARSRAGSGLVDENADLFAAAGITPGATATPPGNPAPATITGTQAPANAVPGIDTPFNLNIPKGSFATLQEADAAVANGSLQVQPGDIVLINGVPLKWVDGP